MFYSLRVLAIAAGALCLAIAADGASQYPTTTDSGGIMRNGRGASVAVRRRDLPTATPTLPTKQPAVAQQPAGGAHSIGVRDSLPNVPPATPAAAPSSLPTAASVAASGASAVTTSPGVPRAKRALSTGPLPTMAAAGKRKRQGGGVANTTVTNTNTTSQTSSISGKRKRQVGGIANTTLTNTNTTSQTSSISGGLGKRKRQQANVAPTVAAATITTTPTIGSPQTANTGKRQAPALRRVSVTTTTASNLAGPRTGISSSHDDDDDGDHD